MDKILFGDYHTHSEYSGDSKSKLKDNFERAVELGLKEIAVTDHGIKHRANGMSKKQFFKQVEQVNELRKDFPNLKIYQSIEANLLNRDGLLDIDDDMMPYLDFLMMGYHLTSKPTSFSSFLSFNLPEFFPIFKPSQARMEKNTTAYLRCIERYPLSFVNHLNYKMPVLIRPIAKLCKETNTMIELNGKRIFFSPQEVDALLEEGVDFIVNSDAHTVDRVGETSIPFDFIEKYKIPLERIKNINNLPPLKLLNTQTKD